MEAKKIITERLTKHDDGTANFMEIPGPTAFVQISNLLTGLETEDNKGPASNFNEILLVVNMML